MSNNNVMNAWFDAERKWKDQGIQPGAHTAFLAGYAAREEKMSTRNLETQEGRISDECAMAAVTRIGQVALKSLKHQPLDDLQGLGDVRDSKGGGCSPFEATEPYALNPDDFYED